MEQLNELHELLIAYDEAMDAAIARIRGSVDVQLTFGGLVWSAKSDMTRLVKRNCSVRSQSRTIRIPARSCTFGRDSLRGSA
jgi:hypothetical protein